MEIWASVFVILSVGLGQRGCAEGASIQNNNPINPLIVDGYNADIRDYPYIVSIMVYGFHTCGGSILSRYYVITGAHCFDYYRDNPKSTSIRAGSTYQGNGGSIYLIDTVTIHPNFNFDTMDFNMDYDIAIMKTASPFIYDGFKQPIQLATTLPYAGTFGVVVGWGQLRENSAGAYQLQVVEVPVVSRQKCISTYINLTDRMFCAGYMDEERGTCTGDSGGPLTVDDKLIGLVSYTLEGCARPNIPTVFTSIPNLYYWIKSNVIFD